MTGEELSADDWRKKKTLAWNPPWVFVGLLGGVLPLLILMLVCQKKTAVTYSLGQEARKKLASKRRVGGVFLAGFVLLLVFGIASESSSASGIMMLSCFVCLIISLVVFILATPLRAVGHRKGWLKIKGVSGRVLDELKPVDFNLLQG